MMESSITADVSLNAKQLHINTIKNKMTYIIEAKNISIFTSADLCENLACKCIFPDDSFRNLRDEDYKEMAIWLGFYQGLLAKVAGMTAEERERANDVSNKCLIVLRFLMVLEIEEIDIYLNTFLKEARSLTDKHYDPDEIMLELIYPIYKTLAENKYEKLKANPFIEIESDPFHYDQVIAMADTIERLHVTNERDSEIDFYNDNLAKCNNISNCNVALHKLDLTWQKIVNIMSFPWNSEVGSLIANFDYLLEECSTAEEIALSNRFRGWGANRFRVDSQSHYYSVCDFNLDGESYRNVIRNVATQIFKAPIPRMDLINVVGFLGYSRSFNVMDLSMDYMLGSKPLLPLYGFDRDDGDDQNPSCNVFTMYYKWITNIKHTTGQFSSMGLS